MAASTITAAVEGVQPVRGHKWLVAAAVMLGAFLQVLDTSIVNVALPYMQGSFAASVDEVTWVVTSFLISNGVMIPLTGWIAARVGRKRYFILSVLMFMAASALCGLARSIDQMVAFRLIQGAAGAAMMPLAQAILFETFPPAEHTLAMAVFGLGIMVGPIAGPTLGGWITMNWNWRWTFFINIPAGAVAALMVYLFVHDPPYLEQQRGSGRVDYLGIVYLVLGLGLLQVVLDRGQRADWFAAQWVRYFTVASGLALVALVIHELRFPDPIIDLRMLKVLGFTLAICLIAMQSLVLFSINLLNPLFTQELLGYDAWQAGLVVAPRGVGVVIALISVGQLSRRGYDLRPLIGFGFTLAAYEIWTMSHWNLQVSESAVLWPILLFGLGLGIVFPTVTAAGLGQIKPERMGFASSLFNMMVNTGAAFGISSVSNMLTSHEQTHQAYLVQHFSVFDAWKVSRGLPAMPGGPTFNFMHQMVTGQHQGLGQVYSMIQAQAWLLAYNDVYRILALIALFCAPWCLLLSRAGGGAKSDAVMH
ncbi:MAG: DHA2 family efflux MFS transporter permease subunit [Candidatus Binataceae bacterium]|nr:DHA2 family efflux MFS transporter permease subunit [Candidatus Binataceae bacterium]